MRISEETFRNGGEVDYRASLPWEFDPPLGKVTGRASLRKCGLEYQAYIVIHTRTSPFGTIPRIEVILFETRDLASAVIWCNRYFHQNPDHYDTVE